MILILCSLVLTQASIGGTFLEDDTPVHNGSGVTTGVEGADRSESGAAAGQALFLTWVASDSTGEIVTLVHPGTAMHDIAGSTLQLESLEGETGLLLAITGFMSGTVTT
jgi:hypothetical protein